VITGGATYAAPMVASGTLYVGSWNGFSAGDGGTVRAFALGSSTCQSPPPSTVVLGSQTVQPTIDDNALGAAEAFQTTAGACGTVSVLSIYVDASSTATTLVAGLYGDSAGHPGTLISQGTSSHVAAGAWNDIPISGAIVTSGATYWLAVLDTQSGTLRFRDGSGCKSEMSQQTNLATLPATWVSGPVYPSCPISAYGRTAP